MNQINMDKLKNVKRSQLIGNPDIEDPEFCNFIEVLIQNTEGSHKERLLVLFSWLRSQKNEHVLEKKKFKCDIKHPIT